MHHYSPIVSLSYGELRALHAELGHGLVRRPRMCPWCLSGKHSQCNTAQCECRKRYHQGIELTSSRPNPR